MNLGRLLNALSVQKKIPFQLKTKARDWLQNMNLIFDFDHWCFDIFFSYFQPMEVYVDDEAKLTLHGLQQHFFQLKDAGKKPENFLNS